MAKWCSVTISSLSLINVNERDLMEKIFAAQFLPLPVFILYSQHCVHIYHSLELCQLTVALTFGPLSCL